MNFQQDLGLILFCGGVSLNILSASLTGELLTIDGEKKYSVNLVYKKIRLFFCRCQLHNGGQFTSLTRKKSVCDV